MLPHPKSGDYFARHRDAQMPDLKLVQHYLRQGSVSKTKAGSLRNVLSDEMTPGNQPRVIPSKSVSGIRKISHDIVGLIRAVRSQLDSKIIGIKKSERAVDAYPIENRIALKTMIGGIAHHFNNLFMGIQGNVSLICCKADISRQNDKRLKRIEKLIQSESILINDLLNHLIRQGPGLDTPRRSQLANQIVRLSAKIWPGPKGSHNDLVWTDLLKDPGGPDLLTESIARILSRLLWEIHTIIALMLKESHHRRYEFNRLQRIEKYVLGGFELLQDLFDDAASKTRLKAIGP